MTPLRAYGRQINNDLIPVQCGLIFVFSAVNETFAIISVTIIFSDFQLIFFKIYFITEKESKYHKSGIFSIIDVRNKFKKSP